MPDAYLPPEIETDREQIADSIEEDIAIGLPGWVAAPASLEGVLIRALASVIETVALLTVDSAAAVVETVGPLAGLPPAAATQAVGTVEVTANDTAGHSLADGTTFIATSADGEQIGLEAIDTLTIESGQTTGTVDVQVEEDGEYGNGLTGNVDLVEVVGWVNAATLVGTTAGGTDEEDPDAYRDRLSRRLTLLADRPILPSDFQNLALDVPGVDRALAINLYNPVTLSTTDERTVTVVVADATGQAVPAPTKALVEAELEARREVNFVVFVRDPTITVVDVALTVHVYPEYLTTAQALVEDALEAYLDPATWGSPDFGDTATQAAPWVQQTKVRINDIIAVADNTEGVDHVTAVTIEGAGVDYTLTGIAPLADAGTITVTVVERTP